LPQRERERERISQKEEKREREVCDARCVESVLNPMNVSYVCFGNPIFCYHIYLVRPIFDSWLRSFYFIKLYFKFEPFDFYLMAEIQNCV
jgi:hypothetical protein